MNGITTANYYYRLRRVSKACTTKYQNTQPAFVDLSVAQESDPVSTSAQPCAILKCKNDMALEILSSATPEFLKTLIGVTAYAE